MDRHLRLTTVSIHDDGHPLSAWPRPPHVEALARSAHAGDQTDQESRSAGHRAAARVTAMNINQVDATHDFRR